MKGFSQLPNAIFDAWNRTPMTDYERRVFGVILRRTFGWHCEEAAIPLSALEVEAGIPYRRSVQRALERLEHRAFVRISREGHGRGHMLRISINPVEEWDKKGAPERPFKCHQSALLCATRAPFSAGKKGAPERPYKIKNNLNKALINKGAALEELNRKEMGPVFQAWEQLYGAVTSLQAQRLTRLADWVEETVRRNGLQDAGYLSGPEMVIEGIKEMSKRKPPPTDPLRYLEVMVTRALEEEVEKDLEWMKEIGRGSPIPASPGAPAFPNDKKASDGRRQG